METICFFSLQSPMLPVLSFSIRRKKDELLKRMVCLESEISAAEDSPFFYLFSGRVAAFLELIDETTNDRRSRDPWFASPFLSWVTLLGSSCHWSTQLITNQGSAAKSFPLIARSRFCSSISPVTLQTVGKSDSERNWGRMPRERGIEWESGNPRSPPKSNKYKSLAEGAERVRKRSRIHGES